MIHFVFFATAEYLKNYKKKPVIDIDINLICWKIHGIDRILHEKNLL
jgi:hypothetical protein